MSEDNNGYLDADQTYTNYYVRELGGTVAQLQAADPSRELREWWKCRKRAQSSAIGTTILGATALVGGVLMGAPLLIGAGVVVAAGSGFLVKHHGEGAAAHKLESEVLDECPILIPFLAGLEAGGVHRAELVSAYDSFVRAAIAGHLNAHDQVQVKQFFQTKLEQRVVFAQAAAEFASAAGSPAPTAPQIDQLTASVEQELPQIDAPPTELPPSVSPNQFEPLEAPTVFDIPVEDLPSLQPLPDKPATAIAAPPILASPVPYLIGDRLRTSLIVSVSGGGKDILLSNALRAFLVKHPNFRVIVMDCKDDPKEYGYYDGLRGVKVYRLNVAIASQGEVVQWVNECLEEFVHLPEQALLICNEGTLIRAKSKRYVQVVDGLVSSGDSRQKYAWEAGQSAHTDDLRINGAARSRFRMLIIGLKGEEMQIEAVLAAKFVADSARNMSDIKDQMLLSPVGRAWCDGQQWFAMPKLENYSGYDRDSRSIVATPEQQRTRAQLEGLEIEPENFTSSSENFPRQPENLQQPGNFSNGAVNPEIQQESEFPRSEGASENFRFTDFQLGKTVFLAVKAAMETGKGKTEIVQEVLECKGRNYKYGCAWLEALIQKHGGGES